MKYVVFNMIEYQSSKQYDVCSKNDMFCEIEYNNESHSTKVISNQNKAIWNEFLIFPYVDTCNYFSMRIYDKDSFYNQSLILDKTIFFDTDFTKRYIKYTQDGLVFFYALSEISPIDTSIHRIDSIKTHYNKKIELLKKKNNEIHTDLILNRSIIQKIDTLIQNKNFLG